MTIYPKPSYYTKEQILIKQGETAIHNRFYETKELELPETLYIRGIDDEVFKGIILQCLLQIEGISFPEGSFFYSLLQRQAWDAQKGIVIQQNAKDHSISIRIEINICHGEIIPLKAEEIQTKICEEITKTTGLHVSSVHVLFKKAVSLEEAKQIACAIRESLLQKQEATDEEDL